MDTRDESSSRLAIEAHGTARGMETVGLGPLLERNHDRRSREEILPAPIRSARPDIFVLRFEKLVEQFGGVRILNRLRDQILISTFGRVPSAELTHDVLK